jgi:hypothetical protein
MTCTRCDNSGFLNLHQVNDWVLEIFDETGNHQVIIDWINYHEDHDVQVCDCCGDGSEWYGVAGEHYNNGDDRGMYGPYAYNGGLCECH